MKSKQKSANPFVRLWGVLSKYRGLLALAALGAVLSVVCTLFAPVAIGTTIDHMAAKGAVDFSAVARLILLLVAIYLGSNLFMWLLSYATNKVAYKAMNHLRGLLYGKLGKLPLRFFDATPHGDTISRFVNDIDTISDGLMQSMVALLSGAVTIVGSIVFMLAISPAMTAVVVLSAPAAFLVSRFITTHSQQLFRQQARLLGRLNGYAEEMIEGHRVVRAFHYEQRSVEQFRAINGELYKVGVKSQFISSLSNPSTRIVNNLAYALVGVLGGLSAIGGRITVGDISSFLIFAVIFAKPFNDITGILSQIQSAAASAQRVFYILDLPSEPQDGPDAVELKECRGEIAFKDVGFSYSKDRALIRHFGLSVASGSKIAIVGQTGAGKTTLVNLLMRFYDVDEGAIEMDGVDIRHITRDSLRRNFGMVLQDTWLFDGTIRDNLAYAKPGVTQQEIVAAAAAAGADGFIRKLERGYDTVIRNAGDNLSQGQKQLLTIARVMLADPPILILDEATSSIDTFTEAHIQQAFMQMTAGRTSFVIAHRLSTVKNADLIIVMDQGHIVEKGRHDELLQRGGHYAKLYESQFMPPEEAV